MFGIAIKAIFSGMIKRLLGAATALFSAVRAYPREAAIVALLLALAWTWHGNTKRDRVIAAKDAQIGQMIAAAKQAEAKQKAADQSNIAGQLAAIRQQDAAHDQLEAARRSAVSEFRTAGRVRLEAACRSPSGAGVAPLRDNPRPPADGQAPGDLVAVLPKQIDAWSEIELQNAERGQFLRGLVEQGLAVPQSVLPDPAFGGK